MAIESSADFNSYVDTNAHGVSAVLFEVQNSLVDDFPLIDTLFDIDSGISTNINVIMDQEYFAIDGGSVDVNGFEPIAYIKSSDAPFISHQDKLKINAITTNKGTVLVPATTYLIRNVQPDNTGFIKVFLEEE
jgi:hypothetical protein